MSLREDLLNCNKFFILDTKKASNKINISVNDNDETFIRYHYNARNYNKIVKNSAFIYRIPSRASTKRKFYMFGGGIIDDIVKDESSESDNAVSAIIKKPFVFQEDIYQDNVELNKIKWDIKKKKSTNGQWGNFWSQYGILEISRNDFEAILNIQDITSMNEEAINEYNSNHFNRERHIDINYNTKFTINIFKNNKRVNSYEIDITEFKNIGFKNQRMSLFSEYMIENYITKILNKKYKKEVTSDTGSRYDIVTFNNDDSIDEIIEIHLTAMGRRSYFTISQVELDQAKQLDNYKIYNIFNIDVKKQSCDIEILGYKEIIENYNLVPITYRVEQK